MYTLKIGNGYLSRIYRGKHTISITSDIERLREGHTLNELKNTRKKFGGQIVEISKQVNIHEIHEGEK
ncbi:MAG: hypothetical protein ACE3JK_10500 [Sporolactobacillus sp.]